MARLQCESTRKVWLSRIKDLYNRKEAAEFRAKMLRLKLLLSGSAQCLVLSQISKHNMRSCENVLIPVGELGCSSGKSDGKDY